MVEAIKGAVNFLSSPTIFFNLTLLALVLAVAYRKTFTKLSFGAGMFAFIFVFLVFSMFDANFRAIVAKPDNVPIVGMLVLVIFFMWYSMRQGVLNDDRMEKGLPPVEKERSEKVFVWPDLVYSELIALVVATVVLVVWSILLEAPIEEPASLTRTPNPSKAPWYFLGLQEMLVYFDPWLAGVVFPSLIIVGLIAIPYIDTNPKGNGYYTFKERKFEIVIFLFGFVVLWVSMIVLGTFLRGPNWNFFGPYEYWDVHKLEALVNMNLSEYIYVKLLGVALPKHWLPREIFGILLMVAYFAVPPFVLAKTWFKRFYAKMSPLQYHTGAFLFLMLMLLPIKMYLRWTVNLKYIVAVHEFFFNI